MKKNETNANTSTPKDPKQVVISKNKIEEKSTSPVPLTKEKEKEEIKSKLTESNSIKSNDKKVSVIDYKEDTSTVTKISKDPLDKIKKEDLIIKIKEFEDKFKLEKEERRKVIEAKNKEIESKEKVIFSMAGTNKKLSNELEDLRKEVDEKLDKIGIKQIKDTERENELKKKQQPLEHVLKVKEKELKNALSLLEVFKKDKENLQKNLNERSDFKQVLILTDKLKEEENKNSALESEVKSFTKLHEEHNKCENNREEFEKEKRQMINEMKYLKDKNKEYVRKIKEEEEKTDKLNRLLVESKIANSSGLGSSININKDILTSNSSLPTINKVASHVKTSASTDVQKYWNLLESADKVGTVTRDDTALKKKAWPRTDKEYKEFLKKERTKFSLSLQNKNFRIESMDNRPKLFGNEEKQILAKLLPINEISKLEKKFEAIDLAKSALERKCYTETKLLMKKTGDLEERLELAVLQNKETEQKNKIQSYQINEHRNENKILSRKLIEMNNKLKSFSKALQEKEEENKKLIFQVHDTNSAASRRKVDEGNNNSRSYNESKMDDQEEYLNSNNVDHDEERDLDEDKDGDGEKDLDGEINDPDTVDEEENN